ncbi:hypothetical protein U729_3091 (plasmid) [Clostridium baratii str. Sullivan]|uniref:Uncharacterized protein n=1 Tax=Clostridium baratii str. Sullivan TaxID=1415775 RepID=A0A0A7G0F3_9CLOT|nr:hypothetical protein [Clostridium baratii]AIY85292.1 hypothetical protein U729_3091 [Clostridium baratii str. Sullivan]
MKKELDRNGRPLNGTAEWLRMLSKEGGLKKHDENIKKKAKEKKKDEEKDKKTRPLFKKTITKF